MPANLKSISGRRELAFHTLEDIVADAERLVASRSVKTLGNWPLSQLLTHLAQTVNCSIDGFTAKAPLFIRIIGPLLKSSALKNKMKPGIKLPKGVDADAFPTADSPQAAFEQLRRAVARTKTERMTAPHPAFGKMTHEEWVLLHLRHSEMHLSFAV